MSENRTKIESKDRDDNLVTVYVTRPTREENAQAQIVASKMFGQALKSGALMRKVLDKLLIEQGIWSDAQQKKVDKIDKDMRDKLIQLKKGGIKLSKARNIAIDIRLLRMKRTELMSERNDSDDYTAEAQSDNAKFDYLASQCIKNEQGEPYFSDIEDYRENGDQTFVIEAAGRLASMLYGLDDNWEENLPENQFLKQHGFVDDELRLVNKDGKHVTTDNKLIDSDFRYINEAGEYVDQDGNKVGEDGLPIVKAKPFLDDDGKIIK